MRRDEVDVRLEIVGMERVGRRVEGGERVDVVVRAVETWLLIKSCASEGVTFSMTVKEGRRSTVVGRDSGGRWDVLSGRGRLEAESISFYSVRQQWLDGAQTDLELLKGKR